MELAFATRRLRTLCSEVDEAVAAVGEDAADVLRDRIADLRAASSPVELLAGSPHLVGGENPMIVVVLTGTTRLVCAVNQQNVRRDESGEVDWRHVRRLRITAIEEADVGG